MVFYSKKFRKKLLSISIMVVLVLVVLVYTGSGVGNVKVKFVINGKITKPLRVLYTFKKEGKQISFTMSAKKSGEVITQGLPAGVYRVSLWNNHFRDINLYCINSNYDRLNGNEIKIEIKSGKTVQLPNLIFCQRIKLLMKKKQSLTDKNHMIWWTRIKNTKYHVYLTKSVKYSKYKGMNGGAMARRYEDLKTNKVKILDKKITEGDIGVLSTGVYGITIIAYTNTLNYTNFRGIYISGPASGMTITK